MRTDSRREYERRWREKNKDKLREQYLARREAQVQKTRERRNANRTEFRAKHNEYVKRRYKNDPAFALKMRMSAALRQHLKTGKGASWQELVGYSVEELKAHLESKFSEGMSWENRGAWHIDHIRPLASFDIDSVDSPDFKVAWALDNLQPLWAADNIKKGAKYG